MNAIADNRPFTLKLREKLANALLEDVHLHNVRFGYNSVTLTDLITISTTATTAPQQIGMGADGIPEIWDGSASVDLIDATTLASQTSGSDGASLIGWYDGAGGTTVADALASFASASTTFDAAIVAQAGTPLAANRAVELGNGEYFEFQAEGGGESIFRVLDNALGAHSVLLFNGSSGQFAFTQGTSLTTMTAANAVTLNTGGDVTANPGGAFTVTASGNVDIGSDSGGTIDLGTQSGSGAVSIGDGSSNVTVTGDTVTLDGATLDMDSSGAATLDAATTISLTTAAGELDLTSNGGPVDINSFSGAITLDAQGGNIALNSGVDITMVAASDQNIAATVSNTGQFVVNHGDDGALTVSGSDAGTLLVTGTNTAQILVGDPGNDTIPGIIAIAGSAVGGVPALNLNDDGIKFEEPSGYAGPEIDLTLANASGEMKMRSGGTANVVLESQGGQVEFIDVDIAPSAVSGSSVVLAATQAEWDTFAGAFGSTSSIVGAINQASVSAGLDPKQSVRAATTSAGTLASDFEDGDTIDGVSLATGDRILIKDQASPVENGIYVVQASGAPTRASDFDGTPASEVSGGAFTFVENGTDNATTGWVVTGEGNRDVGVDAINWAQFSGVGTYTAGNGLTLVGSEFAVSLEPLAPGLAFNGNDLEVQLDGASLAKSGSGVAVNLDSTTLQITGSGLRVNEGHDFTFTGNNTFDGTVDFNGVATFNTTSSFEGALTGTGGVGNDELQIASGTDIVMQGNDNIVPATDGQGSVGTASLRWGLVRAAVVTSGDHIFEHPSNGGHYRMTEHPTDGLMIKNENTGQWYKLPMVPTDAPDWE